MPLPVLRTIVLLATVGLVGGNASPATACSAVLLQLADTAVMARNYDWHIGNALVMLNQPGIEKQALSFDNPAHWTSKFGSVTINQYGRELPTDGMNEAGLAIAVLWLDATKYPDSDERPSVTSAQWVQFQLDTAESVADVVASDQRLRVTPYGGARLHYFVADASGDCAVIEFLDGRMVVHRGETPSQRLITNSSCRLSREHLGQYLGFGGRQDIPRRSDSLSRYAQLAKLATDFEAGSEPVEVAALDTIQQVCQHSTQWQIAYDLKSRIMHFRTQQNERIRTIDLTEYDFAEAKTTQILDIQAPLEGGVLDEFRNYTREANRQLVESSTSATDFTRQLPANVIRMLIDYPEVFCHPVSTAAVQRR